MTFRFNSEGRLSKHSDQEKIYCLERELKHRRWVYPNLVRAGKMSVTRADLEIKIIESIIDDYRQRTERVQQ